MLRGDLGRLALVTLSLGAALHCGPAAPELARGLSDRTLARLARAPAVYAPAAGGAATGETAAMAATLESALEPQARARVRHDPALDLVAAALAENFSDQGQRASPSLAQWLLWKSGSVAIYRDHSGGYVGGRGRFRTSLENWTTRAAHYLNRAPGSTLSYGLARFTEGRVTAESSVFGYAAFDVEPFSKTYPPGGPLTLALRPRIPYRELRFLLDQGDAVAEETLAPRPDGSFFVSRPVPSRPGRYFIEVQGPPPERATLLMVPIYVGVPEPAAPDEIIQHPPPGPQDLAGWQAWLASTYDAERARHGKPPVETDARLAAMAVDRSVLFSSDRRVPRTDSDAFAARLTAMGLAPAGFSEDVTTLDATDAVLLKLLRPSVRQRLVLSDRVLFGAGASPRPAQENRPQSYTLVEETVVSAPAVPARAPGPAVPSASPEPVPPR